MFESELRVGCLAKPHLAIRPRGNEVAIMACHQNRFALSRKLAENLPEHFARVWAESARWFIEQKQWGRRCQLNRECECQLLPGRQVARMSVWRNLANQTFECFRASRLAVRLTG